MIETDIALQYRIIEAGAGWIENTGRGRLRFEGADRLTFLQALLSNEVASVPPGAGTYALYLTPQGRMIADLHVFVRPDFLLVDVPAEAGGALARTFDSLVFAEDVRVTDVSPDLRQLSVIGGRADAMLARALDLPQNAVRDLPVWSQLDVAGGILIRTDAASEGSWDVVVAQGSADGLIAEIAQKGGVRMSASLVDAIRIDAGRPKFGIDMTTETIPLEAGLLERAISQTKGCYVGQEVIIRVLHRGGGRVAKRLVRLRCDATDSGVAVPIAGAVLTVDGREVGHVTSASLSPRANHAIALGYAHRDVAETGQAVKISWPGNVPGASAVQIDAIITGLAA